MYIYKRFERERDITLSLMGSISRWYIRTLVLSFLCSFVHSSNNTAAKSLDVILHKHAFKSLVHHQPHTGALYQPALPPNLAGMQVSVVRLRSRTLWRKGANFSNFRIPSRTLPIPHVKRLFLVYQDLGNWSSQYYNAKGCSLVSSVVGFMAYDASNLVKNITRLKLNTMDQPISVQFPGLRTRARTKCAAFGANGEVYFSGVSEGYVCYGGNEGHFSIVVKPERRKRVSDLLVGGFVVGFVLVLAAGFVGGVVVRVLKGKRIDQMERDAEEGVVLGTMWIGNSKMHCATVTRTHPALEDTSYV